MLCKTGAKQRVYNSAVEFLSYKQGVIGSNPIGPNFYASLVFEKEIMLKHFYLLVFTRTCNTELNSVQAKVVKAYQVNLNYVHIQTRNQ